MRQAAAVREEARSNLLIKLLAISTASRVGRRELGKRICQTEDMSPSNKQIRRDSLNEIATLRVGLRDTDP
jgi:hypothetical protein